VNAATDNDLATEVALARRFAALSGPFNPQDALTASIPESRRDEIAILVASHLAKACDTHAGPEGSQWLMRASERRWDIENLTNRNELGDAIAWRSHQQPFDETARDVIAALQGVGSFEPAALERMLTAAIAARRAIAALDTRKSRLCSRMGWSHRTCLPPHGGGFLLPSIASTIRHAPRPFWPTASKDARSSALRSPIGSLRPKAASLFMRCTSLVYPELASPTLLEVALRDAAKTQGAMLVVRLDFDRPVLDVLDQVGLTLEVARQIASQLPEQAGYVRELRLKSLSSGSDNLKGRGRDTIPIELAEALGKIAKSSKRTVVMVLDTLEVLRGRGETHPQQLFQLARSIDGIRACTDGCDCRRPRRCSRRGERPDR